MAMWRVEMKVHLLVTPQADVLVDLMDIQRAQNSAVLRAEERVEMKDGRQVDSTGLVTADLTAA